MKDILTPLLVIFAVFFIMFGSFCLVFRTPPPSPSERTSACKAKVEQDGGTLTIKHGERLLTIEHDGHLFVIHMNGYGSSMIHHPGCECLHTPPTAHAGKDEG